MPRDSSTAAPAAARSRGQRLSRCSIATAAFRLFPGGGEPQYVRGLKDDEIPIQWDESGTKLYVWDRIFPAHIFLIDLKSGARQPWTTLVPPDSAGVLYGNIVMTPDGKTSVYRYRRAMTTLFLADGLK